MAMAKQRTDSEINLNALVNSPRNKTPDQTQINILSQQNFKSTINLFQE